MEEGRARLTHSRTLSAIQELTLLAEDAETSAARQSVLQQAAEVTRELERYVPVSLLPSVSVRLSAQRHLIRSALNVSHCKQLAKRHPGGDPDLETSNRQHSCLFSTRGALQVRF